MGKLILLDRDGVINFDSPEYVKSPSQWQPLPGSLEAIARIRNAGYLVGLCSNQAGVARGRLTADDLDAIHAKMTAALTGVGGALNYAAYCKHHPDARCECRKPRPGMLTEAMRALGVTAHDTLFVGDSLSDVQASLAAGCTPVLVRTGNGLACEAQARALTPLSVYDDLSAFARALVA